MPWALTLALVVLAMWCTVYDRWSPASWVVPVAYGGDADAFSAHLRAARDGHLTPIATTWIPELNAPYQANWNDYPRPQRVLLLVLGQLAKTGLGIFGATNLALLFAHVAAALSMFGVARYLRIARPLAWGAGLLFASTPVIWIRSAEHLVLSLYWHLPCALLVAGWCARPRGLAPRGGRFVFALVTAVVAAWLSIYYAAIFLQLLGLGVLAQLLSRRPRLVLAPALLGLTVMGTLFVENFGTLAYAWTHERNAAAVSRSYADLESFALRPVELIVPSPRLGIGGSWGFAKQRLLSYFDRVPGEGSAYLGLPATAGVALLAWPLFAGLIRRRPVRIAPAFAVVSWVLAFTVVGGINTTLGAFAGFVLLRGGGRSSIWLIAIGLLYGAKRLSRLSAGRGAAVRLLLPAAVVGLGLLDHGRAPQPSGAWRKTASAVEADRDFVQAMEATLPHGAMVFEFPPTVFPESGPVGQMESYNHLVPYLFSSQLRFSFGTDKGRARESWQPVVALLGPRDLAEALEQYGFSAILIDRRGLTTWDADIVEGLVAEGRRVVAEDRARHRVVLRLRPSAQLRLPDTPPVFGNGWLGRPLGEAGWTREKEPEVVLYNPNDSNRAMRFSFTLSAPNSRLVTASRGTSIVAEWTVGVEGRQVSLPLLLPPGETRLTFRTDGEEAALELAGRRRFARFGLANARLENATAAR